MFRGASDHFTMLRPQTVSTAGVTAQVDLAGADFAQIVWCGDTAATNPSVLSLTEGDTTAATTAIAAATGDDTTDGFTIPAADTSNGSIVVFNVDCRKRKRYLRLNVTPGVSQVLSATFRKGRRSQVTTGATAQNVDAVVEI